MADGSTVWAAFAMWWRREFADAVGNAHPHLLIYTAETTYHLHNRRLYTVAEGENGFRNTTDPFPDPEDVTHVVAERLCRLPGQGEHYWPSWQAFAEEVGLAVGS